MTQTVSQQMAAQAAQMSYLSTTINGYANQGRRLTGETSDRALADIADSVSVLAEVLHRMMLALEHQAKL